MKHTDRLAQKAARRAARKDYRAQAEAVWRLGGKFALHDFVAAHRRPVRCPACKGTGLFHDPVSGRRTNAWDCDVCAYIVTDAPGTSIDPGGVTRRALGIVRCPPPTTPDPVTQGPERIQLVGDA